MKKVLFNKGSSPRNVVGDLPLIKSFIHKECSLFNKAKSAGDCRQRHSAMTTSFNEKAFTLIELLVVVLIIGILSAIALPQYQKAVKKTRLIQALPTLSAISRAKVRYYLANGSYTNDLDALDVNIPYTSHPGGTDKYMGIPLGGTLFLSSTGPATIWRSPFGFTLEVYENEAYCYGDESLCKSLGEFHFATEGGTNVYKLKF